jgi:hypothetical protein
MSFLQRQSSKSHHSTDKETSSPSTPPPTEIIHRTKESSLLYPVVIGADFEDSVLKNPKRVLPVDAVEIKNDSRKSLTASKDGAEEPFSLFSKFLSIPQKKVVHPNHVFVKKVDLESETKPIFEMDLSAQQTVSTDPNLLAKEDSLQLFRLLDKVDGKSDFDFHYETPPTNEGLLPFSINFSKFDTPVSVKFGSHPEPFFFTCCLMDMEDKIQISENFTFSTDKMGKFSFVTKRNENVVLYIRIAKILQGDEDSWMESYLKPEKIKDINAFDGPASKQFLSSKCCFFNHSNL